MAKQPKKATKAKTSVSSKANVKPKFDMEAFVFNTPITTLEECLKNSLQELGNLVNMQNQEPEDQEKISQLSYWVGVWQLSFADAKRRGMETVPTCAIENRILGIYKG